jgi:hypothetical protein
MSLRLANPVRDTLSKTLPLLDRPSSECSPVRLQVEESAANGLPRLIRLSRPIGPPHSAAVVQTRIWTSVVALVHCVRIK